MQIWYSYSAQVEGMGGVVLRWGVFGRFRWLTTGRFMGAVWIWVSGLTHLKAIKVLHDNTHPLDLPCRRRRSRQCSNVSSLLLHYPKPSTLEISLAIDLNSRQFRLRKCTRRSTPSGGACHTSDNLGTALELMTLRGLRNS